jgi:hypothetical protein
MENKVKGGSHQAVTSRNLKVAITVLNMPDGGWHWTLRTWDKGIEENPSIFAAKQRCANAAAAFGQAWEEATNRAGKSL